MQDATEREIVHAYRHLARKLHPDLLPDKPRSAERFRAVQEAYDTLSDPALRRQHDTALAAFGVVPPGASRPLRRRWWAVPVCALALFVAASLAPVAVVGWDTFRGFGAVIAAVVFLAALLVFLALLLRAVLTR